MKTLDGASRSALAAAAVLALLATAPVQGAVTKTELAGNDLPTYPYFEYVKAINADSPVHVAIDPTRFPAIVGRTCDVYVVAAKSTTGWNIDNSLTDVTTGGSLTRTFVSGSIQANTFLVAGAFELSADAGTGLGVGYDVVLDCNRNGLLDGDDYIDNPNNESGFYMVHDTTQPGPLAVAELTYNLSSPVATTFGIPLTALGENVFFPAAIATMGRLPLIVISHGNGHSFEWYDHIGNHLASYGYVVMSHATETEPNPRFAAITTLGHTDAFIDQVAAGAIPGGGALTGHLDAHKIVWIGHSRGGEGVVIAYDQLFDHTYTPVHFDRNDIRLISSMLPTDSEGTDDANPHDANFHLWTASGDADVNGAADCHECQTYHLHDRATGNRQSTTVQGTGHAWFHNAGGWPYFEGPCPIGEAATHSIQLGYFLPLVKRYVDDNIPAIDFLTRQYESFRPIGASPSCGVVTQEYYDASPNGTVVLDDYQTNFSDHVSSSGGSILYSVDNLAEDRLDDADSDFLWIGGGYDPFNGATQGASGWPYFDTTRGVVFDWEADSFYEWRVPAAEQDFSDDIYLSFRGAQGTRHPYTLWLGGDLTFSVTLRDASLTTSSINIGAYGGGLEAPYRRAGGWHNEMETIRIRLTDFLNNGSGLDLGRIVAVRLDVGPAWGSLAGRVVIDDLALSKDRAVYDTSDNGEPHLTTASGETYDFQAAGEFTVLRRDGFMEIQARQTPVASAPPLYDDHTRLAACVSVNTAIAVRVAGRRVTYQPGLRGEASPDGLELRIDGELVDLDSVPSVRLGAGGRVKKASVGPGIEIQFPDGTYLAAIPGWWSGQNVWYLNVIVRETPASEGILGVIPNGGWLPRLPNGASLGPRPADAATRYDDLYGTFADAWRVEDATSLFDYAPGMSTANFTNRSFPPRFGERCELPGRPPVEPFDPAVAQALCQPIRNERARAHCAFDVTQTSEPRFAETYLQVQQLEDYKGEEEPPN